MIADTEAVAADPHEWTRRPVLRQRWTELAYFHWRYEPDAVQRLLPGGVRVDTFDLSAWFGLIPFEMRDLHVGPTPPFPWLGSFIEINVGIYVVDVHGRRAVWFFSLDVLRSAIVAVAVAVAVARTAFSPPYCWAIAEHKVAADQHRYQMTRRWLRAGAPHADIGFRVGDSIDDDDVTDLDHFLSARWGLVTSRWNRSLYGAVHHPRWPLHRVDDVNIDQNVIEAAWLPAPVGTPHAFYSPGVDVKVAWFDKIELPPSEEDR